MVVSSLIIPIPRLIGVRESAQRLILDAGIPENMDLTDTEVIFDFSATLSAAQGACDEMVKQILVRGGRNFVFSHATSRTLEYLQNAVRLRSEPDTVKVAVD